MADNSSNRRKSLIVSMLAFLLIGGGVFLFFIVQGSDDLTGKGKKNNFHYGSAAREGVSSFFKAVGLAPDEEETKAKYKEVRMKARGFLEDGKEAGVADVSDWMANTPAAAPSASPSRAGATAVPRMSGSGRSLGGGSGGGTNSTGGVSRFSGGASAGNTNISAKSQSGAGGPAGKGTLGALKNASAMLGEGLKSNSAMTASSKWAQGFGVGGGGGGSGSSGHTGGDLAYAKTGLVKLDKIKSGEIASLKPMQPAAAPTHDKLAEKGDKALEGVHEKASEKSKEDTAAKEKETIAKTLIDAGGKALEGAVTPKADGAGPGSDRAGPDLSKQEITQEEKDEVSSMLIPGDKDAKITRTPDGGLQIAVNGEDAGGPYTDIITKEKDGTLTFH